MLKVMPMRKVTEKINFKDIKHPLEPMKNLRKKVEIPKKYFAAAGGNGRDPFDNIFNKPISQKFLSKANEFCKSNNFSKIFSKLTNSIKNIKL